MTNAAHLARTVAHLVPLDITVREEQKQQLYRSVQLKHTIRRSAREKSKTYSLKDLKVHQLKPQIAPMDFTARPVLLTDNIIRALLAELVMALTLKKTQIVLLARQVALVHIKGIRQPLLIHFLFAHLEYTALLVETQSIFLMAFLVSLDITVQQAQKPIQQAEQQP